MNTTDRARLAAVALVMTTPVAAWGIAGVLTSRTIGVVSLLAGLAAVAAAVELWHLWYEGRLARRWVTTLDLLFVAGALLGVGWRSLTTLGTGPSIAGGFFILPGLPLALSLLVAAGVKARQD